MTARDCVRWGASLAFALWLALCAAAVHATRAEYVMAGVGSGTFNGSAFADAPYTIRLYGDTNGIFVGSNLGLLLNPVNVAITVQGKGSAIVNEPLYAISSCGSGLIEIAGVGRRATETPASLLPQYILWVTLGSTYGPACNLGTFFEPRVGQGGVAQGANFATTAGPIAFTSSSDITYSVVTPTGVTATAAQTDLNPSFVGQPLTLSASVVGHDPSGLVAFNLLGGNPCGPRLLTGVGDVKVATCTLDSIPIGTHAVGASYAGDAQNSPSATDLASPGFQQNVVGGTSQNAALAANGGTASASSTYTAPGLNFGAGAIIDGDRKGVNWSLGGGWNDASANAFPDWAQVLFDQPRSIYRVDVYTLQDNFAAPVEPNDSTAFALYGIRGFKVQTWNGSSWITQSTVTGNSLVKRSTTFPPVVTDRIRIQVDAALASYSRITELEAWTTGTPLSATTTTLTSTPNPSTPGVAVTFTASVNGGSPTGRVRFENAAGAILCDGVVLSSGQAQCVVSNLGAGSHSILARYSGDLAHLSSLSSSLAQSVSAPSTNVALAANGGVASASSTYSASFGAAGTIDGELAGAGWGSNRGWNDGTASAYPDWLQVNFSGQKTIDKVVVYTVQDNYAAPSAPTDSMTFSLYGITGFQVQTWNGSTWVTQGTVSGNNLVKRTVTFGAVATDRIRINVTSALASYSRIVEVEAWSAGAVGPVATTTTVSSSANPSTVGGSVTFTATVNGTAPSGGVAFKDGAATISGCSAVALSGSGNSRTAQCATSALTQGTHSITAVSAGDAGNHTSTSAALSQVYNAVAASTNVALAANGGVASASSTYSASFAASGTIDGELAGAGWGSNRGWNDGTASAYPDWLQVNFSGQKTINKVVVYTVQDNYAAPSAPTDSMTFSLYGITGFQVQTWNGSTWVTQATVSGNNLVKRTVSFAAVATDRIRINVTSALASYSRIVEVEAWTATAALASLDAVGAEAAESFASSASDPSIEPGADDKAASPAVSIPAVGLSTLAALAVLLGFAAAVRLRRWRSATGR